MWIFFFFLNNAGNNERPSQVLTHSHDMEELRPDLLPVTSASSDLLLSLNSSTITTTAPTLPPSSPPPVYFDGANFVPLPAVNRSSSVTAKGNLNRNKSSSRVTKGAKGSHIPNYYSTSSTTAEDKHANPLPPPSSQQQGGLTLLHSLTTAYIHSCGGAFTFAKWFGLI